MDGYYLHYVVIDIIVSQTSKLSHSRSVCSVICSAFVSLHPVMFLFIVGE